MAGEVARRKCAKWVEELILNVGQGLPWSGPPLGRTSQDDWAHDAILNSVIPRWMAQPHCAREALVWASFGGKWSFLATRVSICTRGDADRPRPVGASRSVIAGYAIQGVRAALCCIGRKARKRWASLELVHLSLSQQVAKALFQDFPLACEQVVLRKALPDLPHYLQFCGCFCPN